MTRGPAKLLHHFLADLRKTRASGAHTETSFYPALKRLFDDSGHLVDPHVSCIIGLKSHGAGLPDGGLFDATQLAGTDPRGISPGDVIKKVPSRGALEVKLPNVELGDLAASKQVRGYAKRYRNVLITNLREFRLVQHVDDDEPLALLDSVAIADTEERLWTLCELDDKEKIDALQTRLIDCLQRCLRVAAPVYEPQDVAWFLAGHAREALLQVSHSSPRAMEDIAQALTRMLGVGLSGEKGKHFFHSTLVQTLFYGLFSAWVLWVRSGKKGARFRWRDTTELLHLPMLRVLFHEMTRPTDLFSKALQKRIDLAEALLNRIETDEFFKRFVEDEAVEYFYEPFLEAFDPELRKELGVWYTPREVVDYMVERVDRALREELRIKRGLADKNVVVLDPCCGTGTFLVAVLRRIAKTLAESGDETTVGAKVAEAATSRIYGFEILPAPFVVAHLQIGLYLNELGMSGSRRASIYLTNSLTGWDAPADERKEKKIRIPELQQERTRANKIKRKTKVIVILGNPPYNAFAGVQPDEELESVGVYKEDLVKLWKIKKFNLDDLYVRFFRLAERKLYDQSQKGILCYISNASYVADPSFVVFRERMSHEFDLIDIDNLNGDSRETGKLTPDGKPDPSVFSTARNREGIRLGTAVGLFVLKSQKPEERGGGRARVRWREFWGVDKRAELLASAADDGGYASVTPTAESRFSFRPAAGIGAYVGWPRVTELCAHAPISGLAEMRRGGLLAHSSDVLEHRMRTYFDARRTWVDVRPELGGLEHDAGRYPAKQTRERLLASGERFSDKNIRPYALLPLDNRWCYYTSARPLWNEPRPSLVAQGIEGNRFFVTRMNSERPREAMVAMVTTALPDYHLLRPNTVAIPFLWGTPGEAKPNVKPEIAAYLAETLARDDGHAAAIWQHALAITASPQYQQTNASGLRSDFPRIPLPLDRKTLQTSVHLGNRIADLLDPMREVDGVTVGKVPADLKDVGAVRRVDGKAITGSAAEMGVTVRWSIIQRKDVVMPGTGRLSPGHPSRWGETLNVWMNDSVYWSDVPVAVWQFTVGGYQVLKKWLSYRTLEVLGRPMDIGEATLFGEIARRLTAVVDTWPDLDESYQACASAPSATL